MSFSQIDTSKICFDYPTAKKIAIDLTQGDSAKAELKQVNEKVETLNDIIDEKDKSILLYEEKSLNYQDQLIWYESIIHNNNKIIEDLKKDNQELSEKNKNLKTGLKWVLGGLLASILTIVIIS